MAEPIEIIIRKGTGGDATGFGLSGATPGGPSAAALKRGAGFGMEGQDLLKQSAADNKKIQAMVTAFALSNIKRAIAYDIAQMGNQTGAYIRQAEIELALGVGTKILGIGTGIGAAAMVNPVLGVATAIISVGSEAISIGQQYRTLQTNIAKLNTYNNIMQERSGGTFSNGSRGTDY